MPEEKPQYNQAGDWKNIRVTETSGVFLDWVEDCKKVVLEHWTLGFSIQKEFLMLYREKDKQRLPFAFVKKSTGNIHCPALMTGDPYEFARGNVSDVNTRMSCITPTGVLAFNKYEPTHPDFKFNKKLDFSTIKS